MPRLTTFRRWCLFVAFLFGRDPMRKRRKQDYNFASCLFCWVGRVTVNIPRLATLRRQCLFVAFIIVREAINTKGPPETEEDKRIPFLSLSRPQVLEAHWHLLACFHLAIVAGLPISFASIIKAPFNLTIFWESKDFNCSLLVHCTLLSAIPCLTHL